MCLRVLWVQLYEVQISKLQLCTQGRSPEGIQLYFVILVSIFFAAVVTAHERDSYQEGTFKYYYLVYILLYKHIYHLTPHNLCSTPVNHCPSSRKTA